ncbi:MAG: 2-oxoacid:ferredoxin oxidoreductase subunit beta [Deltaproteobacteria bacterium]|jgi:2-oxoglutarate ferredoxin oxidoreductase subunit beta|nr:2-oxoacid:ferredoxin oxidoreductase subunit beta [Deltaproteobacteria bacterium]
MSGKKHIREKFFPHIWCPGCGHGTILNTLVRTTAAMGLDQNNVVTVSGIGCSARISGYLDYHTLHTLHGRALAFATGVKMTRPELTVIVPMGDGDALAIGGNHFIHACRRNINITAFVMNNRIYGMTGGQYSPLSGPGISATTAPYKSIDREFDVVKIASGAGATFVARTTAYHVQEMAKLMKKAIEHKGFSVVEILSQCPTYFGRKNKMGEAPDMMLWFKDNTAALDSKQLAENPALIPRGIFVEEQLPEYTEAYTETITRAQAKRG